MWGTGGGVDEVPLDWYFSEEDFAFGGTKIHPRDLKKFSKAATAADIRDSLRDFQFARIRYIPTEIKALRGQG